MNITYVLPVHNDARDLRTTVQRLQERLREFSGSEIMLMQNGSSDNSAEICAEISAAPHTGLTIRHEDTPKGLGYALKRGLEMAAGDLIVLSSVELPFGFTDIDNYLALSPQPNIALGSKSHPDSVVHVSRKRRAASDAFRIARHLILGIKSIDSQGIILLRRELAQKITPLLECTDYLVQTEIVAWAIRMGETPVEIPIVYPQPQRSTVSPLMDGLRMFWGMVKLRGRLRRYRRPN